MKATFIKFISTFLVLGLLLGCQQPESTIIVKEAPKSSAGSEVQVETVKNTIKNGVEIQIRKVTELRDDRSNYEDFKKNLNVYEATIIVPAEVYESGEFEIRRSFDTTLLDPRFYNIAEGAEPRNGNYIITDTVMPWMNEQLTLKSVTYKVYTGEYLNGEQKFLILPDVIISKVTSSVQTLESLNIPYGESNFGVVFFEEESTLRTNGSPLAFSAQRLFSTSATIETFSSEYALTAPVSGVVGIGGGKINIKAAKARGDLSIILRGTRGGPGNDAVAETTAGTKGAKGSPGVVREQCHVTGKEKNDVCFHYCDKEPENGAQGGQGPKGLTGGVGMVGGDTGSADVIVDLQIESFKVDVLNEPGKGGDGGSGGEGGPGGEGGDPADKVNFCGVKPVQGMQGPKGIKGDTGPAGLDGETQKSSVVIEGIKIL